LSVFNAYSVKHLVVGGYAVSFHAQPRATKDLDLFIRADSANAKATYAALASFGAPLSNITVDDLANARKFIRLGSEPVAVDILPGIDGVNFDEAWARRVEGVIDAKGGLTAFFISKSDLIASKLAAGRLRDLADVEEIRESDASQSAPGEVNPSSEHKKNGGPKS
jgi:hypothetical protein